ncbi:hypothetical protein A2U01_0103282, partial [Trifolium medium]|nr:hypothetical protein [Trifolium medium]
TEARGGLGGDRGQACRGRSRDGYSSCHGQWFGRQGPCAGGQTVGERGERRGGRRHRGGNGR